jgi:hypothetical protein
LDAEPLLELTALVAPDDRFVPEGFVARDDRL